MLKKKQTMVGVVTVLFLTLCSFLVLANIALDVQTPEPNTNLSGLVDINFTFEGLVNYTIEVSSGSEWTLLNASNSSSSPVSVVWNTSELADGIYDINITAINATNSSHVNTTIVSNLLVDNTAPIIQDVFVNTTILSNESGTINISLAISDSLSLIDSVLIGYELLTPLSNNSAIVVGETIIFEDVFSATELNCYETDIICPIYVFVNDSLGNSREQLLFELLIDTDTPQWELFTITPEGPVRPGMVVNLSALWRDHSLNSSLDSTFTVFRGNGTQDNILFTGVLNNTNAWSNYSYTILEEDLIGNLSFRIAYTDLIGNINITNRINVSVDDGPPSFINVSISNSSHEGEFLILNSTVQEGLITINGEAGDLVNITFILNETFPDNTSLFRFNNFFSEKTFVSELGPVSQGSFLVEATPGINIFELRARDQTHSLTQDETAVLIMFLYDTEVNISSVHNRLIDSLTSPAQDLSLRIMNLTDDISSCENCQVNNNISFEINFTSSQNNYSVLIESENGLLFFWNNTFTLTNNSATIDLAIEELEDFFISQEYWFSADFYNNFSYPVFIEDEIEEFNFSQTVFWKVQTNKDFLLNIYSEIFWGSFSDDNSLLIPGLCEGNNWNADLFGSCFNRDSENNTSFLTTDFFGGVAVGNATGFTQIQTNTPEILTNSFHNFNFNIIEFFPKEELFCQYNITRESAIVAQRELDLEDFSSETNIFEYSREYTGLTNNDNYSWNIQCFNELGLNTTIVHNFSVNDNTPPLISNVQTTNVTNNRATFRAAANEPSRFRIYYGTSNTSNGLSSSTSQSSLGTSFERTVSGLDEGRQYYYRIEACDINDNCANSSVLSFDTQDLRDGSFSGGGAGGATSGIATGGTVERTHSHAWDVLRAGNFSHNIRDQQIPVATLRLIKESDTNNAFLTVRTYNGRPAAVSELNLNVYSFFQIEHHGLVGSSYELDLRVPAGSENVRLFRYENGWVEYSVDFIENNNAIDLYRVRLPGFSFFALVIDDDTQSGEVIEIETPTLPEPQEESPQEITGPVIEDGFVAGYQETASAREWMILAYVFFGVIIVGLLVAGGFYAYTQKLLPISKKSQRVDVSFDKNSSFYDLHVFINEELNKGSNSDEIKNQLVNAGWDDLIVDEEIERVMTLRI